MISIEDMVEISDLIFNAVSATSITSVAEGNSCQTKF